MGPGAARGRAGSGERRAGGHRYPPVARSAPRMRIAMTPENRTNALMVIGFAGAVLALGALIAVMLIYG